MKSRRLTLCCLFVLIAASRPLFADQVEIQWEPIDGAAQYELQIARDGNTIARKSLSADRLSWRAELPPSIYFYRLRALDADVTPGPWSIWRQFVVSPPSPQLVLPTQDSTVLLRGDEAPITLKWLASGPGKFLLEILGGNHFQRRQIVEGNEVTIPLPPRDYSWQVRPILESWGRLNVSQWQTLPQDAVAVWHFHVRLSPEAERWQHPPRASALYLELSEAVTPYAYQITSPSAGISDGELKTHADTVALAASYEVSAHWGIRAAGSYAFSSDDALSLDRTEVESALFYDWASDAGWGRWRIRPRLGAAWRQYIELTASRSGGGIGSTQSFQPTAAGAIAGLDVERKLTRAIGVGAGVSYFLPLLLGNVPDGTQLSSSFNNWSVGASLRYWLTPRWGLSLSAALENRALNFQLASQTAPEQIAMNGYSLQLGLIYAPWE